MEFSEIKIEKKIENNKEIINYNFWVNDKFFVYQLISPLNCNDCDDYPSEEELKKIATEAYLENYS